MFGLQPPRPPTDMETSQLRPLSHLSVPRPLGPAAMEPDTPPPRIVLGTTSQARQLLFRRNFNIPFISMAPDIDEKGVTASFSPRKLQDPRAYTLAIANAKADALLPKLQPNSVLITADQVLLHGTNIREKPKSDDECRMFLHSYGKQPATTFTAVVIHNIRTGDRITGVDTCTQHFRPIPHDIIEQLIKKGVVRNCAGGVTVEDELLRPYLSIRQGDSDSFMGLPVRLVRRLLSEINVRI